MAGLDRTQIENLVTCPKYIIEAPKKSMQLKNRHHRNDMKLESEDSRYKFIAFFRISEDFPEDFSVGLTYLCDDGKHYMLYRCNGKHGESLSNSVSDDPHYNYHEHWLKPGKIKDMRSVPTLAYATYQDAVAHFVDECSIIGAEGHFSFLESAKHLQIELDLDE